MALALECQEHACGKAGKLDLIRMKLAQSSQLSSKKTSRSCGGPAPDLAAGPA